jgi:hypothetical protein
LGSITTEVAVAISHLSLESLNVARNSTVDTLRNPPTHSRPKIPAPSKWKYFWISRLWGIQPSALRPTGRKIETGTS